MHLYLGIEETCFGHCLFLDPSAQHTVTIAFALSDIYPGANRCASVSVAESYPSSCPCTDWPRAR